ncbi:MAG: aminopeptidase N [Actinobacteria bacterium]|nr:aminopeptidase N [Actinomycetota bacterium]
MSTTAGNLTRDEAAARAELISDVRYDIHLMLGEDGDSFRSVTRARFRCDDPGAGTFIDLSARSLHHLQLNGTALRAQDRFDGTRIRLDGLAAENDLVVEAACAYQNTGAGLHRALDPVDGQVYLHTQFEPFDAHLVFACFDQPDLKARTTLRVDAPPHWQVVSNMPPTGDSGDGHWVFGSTPPLSTYLVAVVAGPYHVSSAQHGDLPLGVYCRASMADHLDHDEILEITGQGLDFFQAAFDYPYPFAKYDQLFVPEFNFGAMENPGCVTFAEHYIFRGAVTEAERGSRANTILHEMAHMWFGDLVTMRWWDDLWLNESFATFMATLAVDRATRFPNAWTAFEHDTKTWARYQDQLPSTHPVSTDVFDLDAVHQNFDGITYAKGASVLRQLVAWVGEDAFLDGVRAYFRRYEWSNADLDDLLRELERGSGRDDLASWAKEWLQTAGINTLAARAEDGDGRYTRVWIEQDVPDDHPTLRRHRVRIAAFDEGNGRLVRRRGVEMDVAGPSADVPEFAGEPVADLLLVDDAAWTFAKVHLDDRSLATVEAHLGSLTDPLARTLCWGAVWDMVRDSVLPARQFAAIALRNVTDEDDIGMLQTTLRRRLTAAQLWGHPGNARPLLRAMADQARHEIRAAQPSSDLQLIWVRHWISAARDDEHVEAVRALLDGDLSIQGLVVDTELRWHIVKALARIGALDDDAIAAQQRRDPTDLGERNAAQARASRPDARVKATVWERIVGETEMSHSLLKALMRGFMQLDQPHLAHAYIEPYFAHLRPMFEERQLEVALAYGHSMYPSVVVDEHLVQRTDEELRRGLPGPARRVLLEERDTVVRALRTRLRDAEVSQP